MVHDNAVQTTLFKGDEVCPKCGHEKRHHKSLSPIAHSSCQIMVTEAYWCDCRYYSEAEAEADVERGFVLDTEPPREGAAKRWSRKEPRSRFINRDKVLGEYRREKRLEKRAKRLGV